MPEEMILNPPKEMYFGFDLHICKTCKTIKISITHESQRGLDLFMEAPRHKYVQQGQYFIRYPKNKYFEMGSIRNYQSKQFKKTVTSYQRVLVK